VLAVDPSSSISGGSILGDKTRMQKLAAAPEAFIRPSPASGALGGVARRTREAMLLCEAAGHNLIIVETVGVGQSEIEVASMTDFFLLLLLPNAGDELQGIKKGVLELADCFVINKVDADPPAAQRTKAQLSSVMQFLHPRTPGWEIPLLLVSALQESGFDALDQTLEEFARAVGRPDGFFAERRRAQNRDWMEHLAKEQLLSDFYRRPDLAKLRATLAERVMRGETTAVLAAEEWVREFLRGNGGA
jgi:LAO/AO transport system kinase